MSASTSRQKQFVLPKNTKYFTPVVEHIGKLIAIILLRVSSYRQVRNEGDYGSLEKQREVTTRFIEQHDYSFLKEVVDEAEQGDDLDREGLNEVLELARQRKFSVLVVWVQSRLGRGMAVIGPVVTELERCGVAIYEAAGRRITLTGPEAMMTVQQAHMDENELRTIRQRSRGDRLTTALSGRWRGAVPPIGYVSVKEEGHRSVTLEVNPEVARYIRQIFERIKGGQSIGQICRWLLDETNLRTPVRVLTKTKRQVGGLPLEQKHIETIIRNPVYMGCVKVSNYSTYGKVESEPLGVSKDDVALYPAQHQEIVTPQLWLDANFVLDCVTERSQRKPRTADLAGKYLCQGSIWCGCGCNQRLTTGSGAYLSITTAHPRGRPSICKLGRVSTLAIDDCVIRLFEQIASSKELTNEVIAENVAQNARHLKNSSLSKLVAAEKRLKEQRSNLTKSMRFCRSNTDQQQAAEELHKVNTELNHIAVRRNTEQLKTLSVGGKAPLTESDIRRALTSFREIATQHVNRAELKSALRQIISEIKVRPVDTTQRIYEVHVALKADQFLASKPDLIRARATIKIGREGAYEFISPFPAQMHVTSSEPIHQEISAFTSTHPIDLLRRYKELLKGPPSLTQTALAVSLGKSKGHVSQILSFGRIPLSALKRIEANKTLFSHNDLLHLCKMSPAVADAEIGSKLSERKVA